jgi:HEAT repeat protein
MGIMIARIEGVPPPAVLNSFLSLLAGLSFSLIMVVPISAIFAIPIGLDNDAKRNNPVRAACARALGQMGDPLCVGLLARMLFDQCADISTASFLALHTLLPLIKKEHYGCLPAGTGASLGRALRYKDSVLAYKLLAAIEKAGTTEVVPFLEDCVRSRCHEAIKSEEAKRVLSTVLEREALIAERSRLLRPSKIIGEESEFLLRPAACFQPESEDQLLRVATKNP